MLRVSITISGEKVVDRMLQGLEQRMNDWTPAQPAVIAEFQRIVKQAFATEGASTDAGKWPPLKPRTAIERRRQGFPPQHPILHRTGALEAALTEGRGAFVRQRPTSLQYQLSSEVGYFAYHQSRGARRRLPRRAPVSLTADDRTRLMHPIRLYVTGRDPGAQRRLRIG